MMRKGILLFLIPFLVSCVTIPNQRPTWIDDPYDRKYPEDEYLLVVGATPTRKRLKTPG